VSLKVSSFRAPLHQGVAQASSTMVSKQIEIEVFVRLTLAAIC
jgi:hypothetical protein